MVGRKNVGHSNMFYYLSLRLFCSSLGRDNATESAYVNFSLIYINGYNCPPPCFPQTDDNRGER